MQLPNNWHGHHEDQNTREYINWRDNTIDKHLIDTRSLSRRFFPAVVDRRALEYCLEEHRNA